MNAFGYVWIGAQLATGAGLVYFLFRVVRMLVRLPGAIRLERRQRAITKAINDFQFGNKTMIDMMRSSKEIQDGQKR